MLKFLLSISIALASWTCVFGQQLQYPSNTGDRVRYAAMIEMPRAYISGVCILLNEDGEIHGSLFNEFGITAIDFTYLPTKDKVKLHSVLPMLNKWYIKKVLKTDLKNLLKALQHGNGEYVNKKRKIYYKLTRINDDTEESSI